jgi:lipopolysaccharide heptosyltransferase II
MSLVLRKNVKYNLVGENMAQPYKNILVFCLRKIGDAVIATSVPYLLKKAYPKAKITMIVRPLTQEIVMDNPVVDEVMLYNYTHKTSLNEIRQIAADIKQKKFDLAIIADNKPRSAMLAWLAAIPKRVGFENIEFRNVYLKLFYTDIIKIDYNAARTLQAKNHEIFINRFTGRKDIAKMVMPEVSLESKAKIDDLIEQVIFAHSVNNPLKIALCIRSGALTKDWPLQYFREVAERLYRTYPQAVFYIIGSAADQEYADWFIEKTDAPVSSLCGKTTLSELRYIIAVSDLFLTVDTGAAHIAATTATPMVAMYGGTSPRKWGPYTNHAITLEPSCKCHPCDGTKVKCNNPSCLGTITIDDVLGACKKQLEKYRACQPSTLGTHAGAPKQESRLS